MASIVENKMALSDDEDDENLEELRKAALMTLKKKEALMGPPPIPPPSNVIFQPHLRNPNLISIIPEGAPVPRMDPMRNNCFPSQAPRQQPFRGGNSMSTVGTTIKVLPQVQINDKSYKASSVDQKTQQDVKEEVSTKFSRYEDTESESEDESDHEKKESDSSEEDDVLALEDDDDSLEALMAQMEHEIAGTNSEPNKKDKKKQKINKQKNKDTKSKDAPKEKADMKTAIVEPTLKEPAETRVVKFEENKSNKRPTPEHEQPKSLIGSQPLKGRCAPIINKRISPPQNKSPVRKSKSPIRQKHQSPTNRYFSPPRGNSSPKRTVTKLDSPINQRSVSPRRSPNRAKSPVRSRSPLRSKSPVRSRSPLRSKSPVRFRSPLRCKSPVRSRSPVRSKSPVLRPLSPLRRKSPRRVTPERWSPLRKTPDRYYPRPKSPSPYYRARDRDYTGRNRSPSPIKRRSFSPRRNQIHSSPKYYPTSPTFPPFARNRSPSPKCRSRSPIRRRSLSPRNKKPAKPYDRQSSPYWSPPKRRSPSASPKRLKSPLRKNDYSPKRRPTSPRREFNYRRTSESPKRRAPPQYKNYSPPLSPRPTQRSPLARKSRSPPTTVKDARSKLDQSSRRRSKTQSLSLSPSPTWATKEPSRRYKSPLRPRKVSPNNSRVNRPGRGYSPENGKDSKDKRKVNAREGKKTEERRREKTDKHAREPKRAKTGRQERRVDRQTFEEKSVKEDTKEEQSLKVSDNPVFEARRKKFENTCVVEPANKKIRLGNKKNSPVEEKVAKRENTPEPFESKIVQETSDHFEEEEEKSVTKEIDEIDNFLNEDVLDLSGAFWSSDDDLLPKANTKKEKVTKKINPPVKKPTVKERITLKEKVTHKRVAAVSPRPVEKKPSSGKTKPTSPPPKKRKRSPEEEVVEERKEREEVDLRAELSRRRGERIANNGPAYEKPPSRLVQSAFQSALGKKKSKRERKAEKSEKESKKPKISSPPPKVASKEKKDGRRVLVLKRPTSVKMQSAHINVTFPKEEGSDSESSYSSSSSDDRYTATAKRRLPVYMRLGTAQTKHSGSRKVKLRSRKSQV